MEQIMQQILLKLDNLTNDFNGMRTEVSDLKSGQTDLVKEVNGIRTEVSDLKSGQIDIRNDIQNLDERVSLLTKQTSNAVIDHAGEIHYLRHKVNNLEKEILQLKEK